METAKEIIIPIIDCGDIGLGIKDEDLSAESVQHIGEQMKNAFSTVGFCYLKNHGVDKSVIERCMAESLKFFTMPVEVKQKQKSRAGRFFGWFGTDVERLQADRPADFKESFNYCPENEEGESDWPSRGFEKSVKDMFTEVKTFAARLLDCLCVALGLDPKFMANAHSAMGKTGNETTLRTLYYPPVPDASALDPDQLRLAEHSDYGTMALLFQDQTGGMEAKIPVKGYVQVQPIPDTIVVNVGDLMQRWTADSLLATKHRVLIPEDATMREKGRQSVVFYVLPDNDYEVKPFDGSNTYEPTTSKKYLAKKFSETLSV